MYKRGVNLLLMATNMVIMQDLSANCLLSKLGSVESLFHFGFFFTQGPLHFFFGLYKLGNNLKVLNGGVDANCKEYEKYFFPSLVHILGSLNDGYSSNCQ